MDDKWLNRDYSSVEKKEKNRTVKFVKYILIFCAVIVAMDVFLNSDDYKPSNSQSNNQNFDWTDSEDVDGFVDWSSDRQEEKHNSGW